MHMNIKGNVIHTQYIQDNSTLKKKGLENMHDTSCQYGP